MLFPMAKEKYALGQKWVEPSVVANNSAINNSLYPIILIHQILQSITAANPLFDQIWGFAINRGHLSNLYGSLSEWNTAQSPFTQENK